MQSPEDSWPPKRSSTGRSKRKHPQFPACWRCFRARQHKPWRRVDSETFSLTAYGRTRRKMDSMLENRKLKPMKEKSGTLTILRYPQLFQAIYFFSRSSQRSVDAEEVLFTTIMGTTCRKLPRFKRNLLQPICYRGAETMERKNLEKMPRRSTKRARSCLPSCQNLTFQK